MSWWEKHRQALLESPRFLFEVELEPLQGKRFQATGFPDLGPARYTAPGANGTGSIPCLLIESVQSMANRMEAVCWDEQRGDLVPPLNGLPYVRVRLMEGGEERGITSSIVEAHRLNSPYIFKDEAFADELAEAMGLQKRRKGRGQEKEAAAGVVDLRKVAGAVFHYDPSSLLHGVFLTHWDGRLRLTRALSAFIEAEDVEEVASGGVKLDRYSPQGSAEEGFGNVPYHRVEFSAGRITAYLNLDIQLLRSYALPVEALELLSALALWKVQRFLMAGLRLRTACDLQVRQNGTLAPGTVQAVRVVQPTQLERTGLPEQSELEPELRKLLDRCQPRFPQKPIRELRFELASRPKSRQ